MVGDSNETAAAQVFDMDLIHECSMSNLPVKVQGHSMAFVGNIPVSCGGAARDISNGTDYLIL